MQARLLIALPLSIIVILAQDHAFAQKSSRKSAPPPPRRSTGRIKGGKTPLGSVSVANIKFTLDKPSSECPLLVQASDGLKFAGKTSGELCGEAPLSWIGRRFSLIQKSDSKAVWRSELQEPYRGCRGKTASVLWNSEMLTRETSHILLDFTTSGATLTVDLDKRSSGMEFSSVGVSSSGHPTWCWPQTSSPLSLKRKSLEFLGQ